MNEMTELLRWVKSRERWDGLSRVTLGQLVTLLELYGSQSVAAAVRAELRRVGSRAQGAESMGVNYRQKLRRLEAGLGLGTGILARVERGRSCLTVPGEALAQELRMLLGTIRGRGMADRMRLHIAAGDSWVQSVVLPVILDNPHHWKRVTWKVSNLSSGDVIRGLRDGGIHFGLLRKSDLPHRDRELAVPRGEWRIASFSILVGSRGPKRPSTRDDKSVMEALGASVLVLHESLSGQGAKRWNSMARRAVGDRTPIECDTHLQAALAVQGRDAWCIVPSHVAALVYRLGVRGECESSAGGWSHKLGGSERLGDDEADLLCLVRKDRELERIPGAEKVLELLRRELGAKFRE